MVKDMVLPLYDSKGAEKLQDHSNASIQPLRQNSFQTTNTLKDRKPFDMK